MDKYIYAVRKDRKPEIYTDWNDATLSESLHRKLWINDDLRMGSPWLDAILLLTGRGTPQVSGGKYTGRYFVSSLYCLILFWIFDTDKILNEILTLHNKTSKNPVSGAGEKEWYERMHYEIERSDEYIQLKSRFEKNGMNSLDLNGVFHRNAEFAMNNSILDESLTAKCIRDFLLSGQHNLIELYDELISNSTYRNTLWTVNGDFHNPDLYSEIHTEREERSLGEILQKTNNINIVLQNQIMGQDSVIEKISKAYFHNEKSIIEVEKRQGPRGVYLFAGPPGVGKTFTAKLFAESIGINYRKFDMSGYASPAALDELIGISSFYKASKPGVLTSYVNVHPHSILIFDEIEKASQEVIRVFLQILEDGECFDRHYDRNISFRDCIIVMTTNAGRSLYEDTVYDDLTNLPDRVIINALEKDINPSTKAPYFPKEIISRFSSHTIIMFNKMNSESLRKIIRKNIDSQIISTKEQYGVDIMAGSKILEDVVLFSVGGGGDARNASKLAGKLIDNEIYEIMNLSDKSTGKIRNIIWQIQFDDVEDEVSRIYKSDDAAEYLCKRHLVLKYDISRSLSKGGKIAYVEFSELRFESAIDVEDNEIIISDKLRPNKTWNDIFVSKEVRNEMEYFINYLSNPMEYSRINARIPRGALMFGPPGTGKTSLAKVVATESDVNFIAVSADEMCSDGPDKVHDIFRIARKYAPTVLFIDELDATPTASLNAMLTEMDGFKNSDKDIVFVMAATNHADIDKALLRRFDRTFVIDVPDEDGREWFLKHLLDKYKEQIKITDQLIKKIIAGSEGLSMAEIENIVEATVRESIRMRKAVTDYGMSKIFSSYVNSRYDDELKVNIKEKYR